MIDRRSFLRAAASVPAGFLGLQRVVSGDRKEQTRDRFGPLVPDPDGLLSLPEGFRYRTLSPAGATMDDGFLVPGLHDGMAAFPAGPGRTLLVRNHEVGWGADPSLGAFGPGLEGLGRLAPELFYDPGLEEGPPALGGTTTLLYDTEAGELLGHRLSLAGTLVNCAGGPTPWGSWISCEETVLTSGRGRRRDHGYCFEVPAAWDAPMKPPVPLVAMGRFKHEAVAVDPRTGIVYLTEDEGDGLFYRFLPAAPRELARGGQLQALAVRDQARMDTRGWTGRGEGLEPGQSVEVAWVSVDPREEGGETVREKGFDDGAARFARGEGIWWTEEGVYFACTNGGAARKGQIWRYEPGPEEGRPGESRRPGRLQLFLEANEGSLVESADNLTLSPWGDLVVCEDGDSVDHLVGITPSGEMYHLARNERSSGELAGVTFSPDGSTLFVNLQREGLTVAITGPWDS